MRFLLDDEQKEFARSLDALLKAADTPAVVRAWSTGDHDPGRALWGRLAEAGVFGLAVPEEQDGLGFLQVLDPFSKMVQRHHNALTVELLRSIHRFFQIVAGDEFGSELAAVADGQMLHKLVAGDA